MVSCDVLGPGGRVILHAQTPFVQSDFKRPLLYVGKLTMSGAEVKFGCKGSSIDLHTDSGEQRVPVRVKGRTFGFTIQKTDAWIIPKNRDPVPRAVVAPVEEDIGRAVQPNPAPAAQEAEAAPRPEETQGTRLERKACGQGELRVPRAPDEPSAEERARHEVTHLPYQPWCAWCVMEKGRAKPHLQQPMESVKVPEFEIDFCYLLQDPKRRHQPGDQARATTLVMVDVAAQNPLCAATSTKSDENAYPSAMFTAFVKRMAYTKAVLKVDPEPSLKLLADKPLSKKTKTKTCPN